MKNWTISCGILTLILSMGLLSCIPETETEQSQTVEVDFGDTTLYKIWAFGTNENTDSLLFYLDHKDPTYKWAALLPFASYVKDIPLFAIAQLLNDPNSKVRSLTAYVMGQSHDPKAAPLLIEAFDNLDSTGRNTAFNAAILEAVGKTGTAEHAQLIASISTYLPGDSLLTLAQVRALYQMALRDIRPSSARKLMIDRATKSLYNSELRTVAANYLSRFNEGSLDEHQFALIRAFNKNEDPSVQMYLADVLTHCSASQAKVALRTALTEHEDYRVRVAAAKALYKFEDAAVATLMKNALEDSHPKVAETAALYFIDHGEENEAVNYRSWSQDESLHWKVRYILLGAALKNLPFYYQLTKTTLNGELKRLYIAENDPYRNAVILENMAWDPTNTDFILEKYEEARHPIVETTAIRMMDRVLSNEQFRLILRASANPTERQIFQRLKSVIEKGPNGPLCEASLISRKYAEKAKRYWSEGPDFIRQRYDALNLPAQLEAAQYLEQLMNEMELSFDARDYHNGVKLPLRDQLKNLTDSTLVKVETSKGAFTFKLFPKTSPGTVSNFLDLVEQEFYNKKAWHRIVPNFVAQTGCPRGDGYGSLDYTIRSEFGPLHYAEEGYIGMASAGPHTECTQWFVTYGATPHLDGRYTLFGKVISGMETVHQLEFGDQIINVKISNQ